MPCSPDVESGVHVPRSPVALLAPLSSAYSLAMVAVRSAEVEAFRTSLATMRAEGSGQVPATRSKVRRPAGGGVALEGGVAVELSHIVETSVSRVMP